MWDKQTAYAGTFSSSQLVELVKGDVWWLLKLKTVYTECSHTDTARQSRGEMHKSTLNNTDYYTVHGGERSLVVYAMLDCLT